MKFAEGFDGNVLMLAPWYVINVGAVCTVLAACWGAMCVRCWIRLLDVACYDAVFIWYRW